jgi:hypothetical protein
VAEVWALALEALEHLDKETTEETAVFTLVVSLTVVVVAALERLETTPQLRQQQPAAQAPHRASPVHR